ncbi:MAG: hypothetical protein QXZ43_04635 [Candidatus Aenigmatarchaeota archaeon]
MGKTIKIELTARELFILNDLLEKFKLSENFEYLNLNDRIDFLSLLSKIRRPYEKLISSIRIKDIEKLRWEYETWEGI